MLTPSQSYSLSDLLGIHTTILTKTKPWTTVSGEYEGTVHDLLKLSKVSLVYLGENRFARLWQKDDPGDSSYIGPNFNYHFTPLPVTPALPAKTKPKRRKTSTGKRPTQEELQTAETLLELNNRQAEPTKQPLETLTDAMDKIVGHLDNVRPPKMPQIDAVDSMCQPVLHVETATLTLAPKLDTVLCVETKRCSVRLNRLDHILRDELVKVVPSSATDLPVGEHFTDSGVQNQLPGKDHSHDVPVQVSLMMRSLSPRNQGQSAHNPNQAELAQRQIELLPALKTV